MADDRGDGSARRWVPVALWLWVAAVAALAIVAQRPPAAVGAGAPATAFSAARAQGQLRALVRGPHPIGSADEARVRDALVRALSALGAEVHVETGTGVFHAAHRYVLAGTTRDIVARVPGAANRRAVMLAAHYDSVPYGPGAADDGAGVATILETLRAVRAGPPLDNDLRIVLTDGEEAGLLGAAAYVQAHPELAREIGVVLNFEARGSSGQVSMFETSTGNGWLVRQLAAAAPYPAASSLTYTLYKLLPNDTDLTVFKGAGLPGMNFAFIGSFEDYHTPLDDLAHLDPASLQHMGSYALALTRHFGHAAFPRTRAPDAVYFDALGTALVQYPAWTIWLLLAIAAALFAGILSLAARRGELRPWRLAAGFGGCWLVLAAGTAAAYVVWRFVDAAVGDRLQLGDTPSNELLLIGIVAAVVAAGLGAARVVFRARPDEAAVTGALLGFGAITGLASVALPGASYLFEWPLIAALLGVLAARAARPALAPVVLALAAVPAIVLFAPLVEAMLIALGLTGVAVIAAAVLVALALVAASPLLARLAGSWRVAAPVLALGAVGFVIAGAAVAHPSARHPRRVSLSYRVDADHQRAAWVSDDPRPAGWIASFVGRDARPAPAPELLLGSTAPVLRGAAPLVALPPPTATVTADTVDHGDRVLSLHLASPRGAPIFEVRLPAATALVSVAWNGHVVALDRDAGSGRRWVLRYAGVPAEGVELALHLAGRAPVELWLGDRSYGLPALPGHDVRPPDDTVIVDGGDVVVGRAYRF